MRLDELQRQASGLLVERRLGQLAGVDADVGAHDGIGRSVVAYHAIDAGGQAEDAPHRRGGDDQIALINAAFVGGGHVEGYVVGGQWLVGAVDRKQPQAARVEDDDRAAGRSGHLEAPSGTGVTVGGVNVVRTWIEADEDDASGGVAQERQLAVRPGGVDRRCAT